MASYVQYSDALASSGTFASAQDFDAFAAADLQAGGSTATFLGIEEGTALLGVNPATASFMVVITDGNSNSKSTTEAAADAARDEGIIVFAVGVGEFAASHGLGPSRHVYVRKCRIVYFRPAGTTLAILSRLALRNRASPGLYCVQLQFCSSSSLRVAELPMPYKSVHVHQTKMDWARYWAKPTSSINWQYTGSSGTSLLAEEGYRIPAYGEFTHRYVSLQRLK